MYIKLIKIPNNKKLKETDIKHSVVITISSLQKYNTENMTRRTEKYN